MVFNKRQKQGPTVFYVIHSISAVEGKELDTIGPAYITTYCGAQSLCYYHVDCNPWVSKDNICLVLSCLVSFVWNIYCYIWKRYIHNRAKAHVKVGASSSRLVKAIYMIWKQAVKIVIYLYLWVKMSETWVR